MGHGDRRKCKCCLKLFRPDPRKRRHQFYCSALGCRAASKAASQARWLAKPENQSYFSGPVNVARVQAWRARHPGYWRQGRRAGPALQDVSIAQPIDSKDETVNAARSPLQDDIVRTTGRLLRLGQDILATIALGRAACLNGHSVLFTTAVDIINTLAAAQSAGRLKREFQRYLKPAILIVDELGYLPIDKHGADLLFQIISQRYERAPMVITTNRVYKHWSQIFNNDSTLTSAILDRVLHHADTVIIEGKSFRMKDEIEE